MKKRGISEKLKKMGLLMCAMLLSLSVGLCGCDTDDDRDRDRDDDDTKQKNESVQEDESRSETGDDDETKSGDFGLDVERPEGEKWVAMTFDDGPHNVRTEQIVNELNKYGYNATFFVVGNRVDGTAYNGGDAMVYAAENGNEIAIHGYTHEVYYDTCDDDTYREEIEKTADAIHEYLPDYPIRLMRPVGGRITDEREQNSDYAIIMWSVDSEDWKNKYKPGDGEAEWGAKVDTIVDNVMSQVEDGSIILMHDLYESTYDATKIILERLHEEGYKVVTVSELIGKDLAPGQSYYEAPGA